MNVEAGSVTEPNDGRSARRDRNRIAALDAIAALFAEGDLDPSPEAVAHRTGLSPRSVYRYFDDRDALVRAAIARHLEVSLPLFMIHAIGQGDLDDRIARFVDARLRLHAAIAPAARATRMRAVTDEVVREQLEVLRRALREQVEKHFAAELDALEPPRRRARVAAVDVLCELESLDHLRIHRGFSSSEARAIVIDTLHALLAP